MHPGEETTYYCGRISQGVWRPGLTDQAGKSLCFQCFINSLPKQERDTEMTSIERAEGLAYTDKPVPIEPGLSTDIAPINQMVVKLAIQELLRGRRQPCGR